MSRKKSSIELWLSKAQQQFNKFIRLRDRNDPCISCGRYKVHSWTAGHYRSAGHYPSLRFNEDNCHKQCNRCNIYLHGNLIDYGTALEYKLGLDRLKELESAKGAKKYTERDYEVIYEVYKNKISDLEHFLSTNKS